MSGMDGVTACEKIRLLAGPERNVPIIAMSANVLPAQVQRFLAADMNDHIGKPFRPDELFNVIDRWLPTKGSHEHTLSDAPPTKVLDL